MNWQAKIDNIMDTFDFAKVRRHMEAVGWGWASSAEVPPPESRLRAVARELLHEAANHEDPDSYMATGGFVAIKHHNDYLSLAFQVAETVSFSDD